MSILKSLGIHESWAPVFGDIFERDNSTTIIKTLNYLESKKVKICPKKKDIFSEFRRPLDEIKMIFVGQEPYHTPGLATGRAFAVPKGKDSPSLKVIRDELAVYTGHVFFIEDYFPNDLHHWSERGILLINAALTTIEGVKNKHLSLWRPFMEELIFNYSQCTRNRIFCLFGKHAEVLGKGVNKEKHVVHAFPHPAANVYANRVVKLFRGESTFKIIDQSHEEIFGQKFNWLEK